MQVVTPNNVGQLPLHVAAQAIKLIEERDGSKRRMEDYYQALRIWMRVCVVYACMCLFDCWCMSVKAICHGWEVVGCNWSIEADER